MKLLCAPKPGAEDRSKKTTLCPIFILRLVIIESEMDSLKKRFLFCSKMASGH
jgi:hypothetical protein